MEINVWMQRFVQVVTSVSNLSASLKNPNAANGGASLSAPASDVVSTSTLTNATTLAVIRDQAMTTADAFFGRMYWGPAFLGFTMERIAVAIPEGIYHSCKEISPHFGFATPHLQVPGHTYIEIHPANYPSQLEGCIAVGTTKDNDTLDNSRADFDKMILILPQEFTVTVSSLKS